MYHDRFSRNLSLIGLEGMEKLQKSRVAVIGLGGVGSAAAEALARAGVGCLVLIDGDTIKATNLNRQLTALESNLGKLKAFEVEKRLKDINPKLKTIVYADYVRAGKMDEFSLKETDYIVDAIDDMAAKLALILYADKESIPLISSMGMGRRLDPTQVRVADIYKTAACPLAKKLRSVLRKEGVRALKTVFSLEPPMKEKQVPRPSSEAALQTEEKFVGSMAFVPPAAGFALAAQVVRDLLG